jgi:hypothetical protein
METTDVTRQSCAVGKKVHLPRDGGVSAATALKQSELKLDAATHSVGAMQHHESHSPVREKTRHTGATT